MQLGRLFQSIAVATANEVSPELRRGYASRSTGCSQQTAEITPIPWSQPCVDIISTFIFSFILEKCEIDHLMIVITAVLVK